MAFASMLLASLASGVLTQAQGRPCHFKSFSVPRLRCENPRLSLASPADSPALFTVVADGLQSPLRVGLRPGRTALCRSGRCGRCEADEQNHGDSLSLASTSRDSRRSVWADPNWATC